MPANELTFETKELKADVKELKPFTPRPGAAAASENFKNFDAFVFDIGKAIPPFKFLRNYAQARFHAGRDLITGDKTPGGGQATRPSSP